MKIRGLPHCAIFLSSILITSCGSSGGNTKSTTIIDSPSSSSSTPSSSSASSSALNYNQMVNFILPFDDDSAGITNIGAQLNHTPAGKFGYVKPDDNGHFQLNGQRQRFIGVNITSSSAVTSHTNAEKVARRLAKFGVNLVRLHHMDNHFGAKSIINYSAGNSRTLDPVTLDNLDYFVSELKKNGIYVDLNLINSREFSAADGLPTEISQLGWKPSHVLGMVYNPFLQLEKEYAKNILSHRNPYTQLTYAEDPAVAIVEINNENGIFQQFLSGTLDSWPSVFKTPLTDQWNNWLNKKYTSTQTLETAWGAINEALGTEKLVNGSFSSQLQNWNFEQHDTAQGTATTTTADGRSGLKIAISQAGSASWNIQLNQGSQVIENNKIYTLSFWAKADTSRNLNITIAQNYSPWSSYSSKTFTLTTNWQLFEYQFIANATDSNARINFSGFGNQLANVYLSDVSFKSGGSLGKLPAGQSLETKNIATDLHSEAYTQGRQLDWADFLRGVETNYWLAMKQYLQTDLNYGGMVGGTIISTSFPSAQKNMDFVDGHSYWQHPTFPGADWDAVNWTVNNVSMVNEFNNTITGLAKQRINGKPFTVTEYQHASPNSYSAEGPLFIAAFGALQDWDGFVMFAYDANANDNWGAGYFSDFFSMNAYPTKMANMLLAANIFRRGDIAAAKELLSVNWSPTTELSVLANKGTAWNVANGSHLSIPNDIPLTKRLGLDVENSPTGIDKLPTANSATTLTADTNELIWNIDTPNKGVITVNTDKTKLVYGFTNTRTFSLGNVTIETLATQFNWATIGLTAQTGSFNKPNEAASLLLILTGNTENTNMGWANASHTTLGTQWGQSPTRIEVVPAKISLPFPATKTKVWSLNEKGQRLNSLSVVAIDGKAQIFVDGSASTLWYEIEISP